MNPRRPSRLSLRERRTATDPEGFELLGPVGLWRSVLLRIRADWPVAVAAWLLLVAAATLLAAGLLYADTVAVGGLRQALLDAPARERTIAVWTLARADELAAVDAAVTEELEATLAGTGGEVALVVRSSWLSAQGLDEERRHALTGLAGFEGIERHASLAAGRWPEPGRSPIEVTLPSGPAAALGVEVGDDLTFVDRRDDGAVVEMRITGLWQADRDDPYWRELSGADADEIFTLRGPVAVDVRDVLAGSVARDVDAEWRVLPDVGNLRVAGAESLGRNVATLQARLAGALPDRREFSVDTGLPELLAVVGRSILVSRSAILVLLVQFAVLAGYAVVLLAGILIERRRAEAALLRSRGAGPRHMAAMALGEAVLLALPAALAAPLFALGVVRFLGAVGPLAGAGVLGTAAIGQDTVLVSAAAAGACVVGLSLPTLASDASPAGIRATLARQASRTFAQRVGIDVALLVLAAIGLWQLRLYGAPLTRNARGALGVDPLLVAAPAIGLVAGAVLAIRILPRLAEIGERALTARRGLVSPLGARQLARRPLRYTRSALLLMLAAALGTFAAVYTATWTRSQGDQAAYRSAGDARLVSGDYADLQPWAVGPALRSVPGVTAATPIVTQGVQVGRAVRDGQLVALDPGAAGSIVAASAAGAIVDTSVLAGLDDARPENMAAAIPGEPQRLRVTLDSALGAPGETPDDPLTPVPGRGIRVGAVVIDGDGRVHRVQGGDAAYSEAGQAVDIPLVSDIAAAQPVTPRPPLALLALEIALRATDDTILVGSVDLVAVEASDAATGDAAWTPVPLEPAAPGWAWDRDDGTTVSEYVPPDGAPWLVEVGSERSRAPPIFGGFGAVPVVFRLWTEPDAPQGVPAVASATFLASTGTGIGDTVAARTFGLSLDLELVAAVDAFPPLDPGTSFVILDLATLDLLRYASSGDPAPATEWWFTLEPGSEPAVLETLRRAPFSPDEVIGREELTRSLTADPVPLGVVGALGLGSLAAMVFAAIAFLVSATVSTSERIGEFAILRALGLSLPQLSAWLTVENAFLLAFGLAAGSGIGLLLAWLVLPFATLTQTGDAAVPAPTVVVPLDALLPLYGLGLALLLLTVVVIWRQLPQVRITDVLRGRDE